MEEQTERDSIDDEDQRLLKLRMEALSSVKLPRQELEDSKIEILSITPHTSSYRKVSSKKRNKGSRRSENLIILNTDNRIENSKEQDLSMEDSRPKPRPSTGPARFNRCGSSESSDSDSELLHSCTDNGVPECLSKSFSDDKLIKKSSRESYSPRKDEMFESGKTKESDKCAASILCKEKTSPVSEVYSCFPDGKTTNNIDKKNQDLCGCNIILRNDSVKTLPSPSHEHENKPELSDQSPNISIFVSSSLESLMYADLSDPVTGPKQSSSHNNSPEHDSYESGEIRSDSSPEKYSMETYTTKKYSAKSEKSVNAEHLEHSKSLDNNHCSPKTLKRKFESNSSSFPSPKRYKESSHHVKGKGKGLKHYHSSDESSSDITKKSHHSRYRDESSSDTTKKSHHSRYRDESSSDTTKKSHHSRYRDESASDTTKKSHHSRHRKHHKSRDNRTKKSKQKKSKKHSKKKSKHSH